MLALLRVERAVDRGERDLIATLAFGRAEIEGSLGPPREASRTAEATAALEDEAGDFSELWDEPKDQVGPL